MLYFAHVFAQALNNVTHVGARARNSVVDVGARTRNSRTFYVANVPAYGIAVLRMASVRRRTASVRRQGGEIQF
eukprot:scaffold191209_cov31-Attheya_sp.AAC.1